MKEIDELIALQPQNLAAELGSAVIEDELPELSEHEEIEPITEKTSKMFNEGQSVD
jgi:hypothetical protein